jgi:hypothetical protein
MLARTKALLARSQSRIGFWSKLAATPYCKRRVHHAPGKYPFVEFGRRKRPGPGAHDHESADAVRIGGCKAETGRAAPIVTDHGRVANVELPQQAREICDVAVETVRLFADGFLGQIKADQVRDDHAPACSRQRLYKFPVQESPSGIAVQMNNGIAGSLIEVMMRQPLTRLNLDWYGHSLCTKFPVGTRDPAWTDAGREK